MYNYTGGELLDKKLLEHQEKEIELLNDIIFQAAIQGDGGNEEDLAQVVEKYLEHKNLSHQYEVDPKGERTDGSWVYQLAQVKLKIKDTDEKENSEPQYPVSVRFQNAGGHFTDPNARTYQVVAEFHDGIAKKALYWIDAASNCMSLMNVLEKMMSLQSSESTDTSVWLDTEGRCKVIYVGDYKWRLDCQSNSGCTHTYVFSHAFILDSYTRLKLASKK